MRRFIKAELGGLLARTKCSAAVCTELGFEAD